MVPSQLRVGSHGKIQVGNRRWSALLSDLGLVKRRYSIEFVDGDITKVVQYRADGALVGGRSDVVAKDLPEAVRNTITAKYPRAEIVKAETEVRNGIVPYEVKLRVKGENQKVKLNDKGEIIQQDDD